jgi:hypothetical protein
MGRTSTPGHVTDVYTVTFQVAGWRHPIDVDIRLTPGHTTFADIPTILAEHVTNTPDNIIVLRATRVGPTPEQAAEWRGFDLDDARETFEDTEIAQERLPFEDEFALWLRTYTPPGGQPVTA